MPNGFEADWTANLLNQYTERDVPAVAEVQGSAHASATVTVNGVTASRQGIEFYRAVPVDNDEAAVYTPITVQGMRGTTRTETGHMYVARTPEEFEYDADGNLVRDGRWAYEWDGENRLVRMNTRGDVLDSGAPRQRIEFTYDSQWRRIAKRVYLWTNSTFSLQTSSSFLYDGWNLVTEASTNLQLAIGNRQSYVWGLDLSQSLQGAGGVGGLLAILTADSSLLTPCCDANGNVMALVDTADSSLAATYEYDPFGNTLRATGAKAAVNPFRFSTKYTDDEKGLVYYGYRHLSPALGRWLSRDPIEERKSHNLLSFSHNDTINAVDPRGLSALEDMRIDTAPCRWAGARYVERLDDARSVGLADCHAKPILGPAIDKKSREPCTHPKWACAGYRYMPVQFSCEVGVKILRGHDPFAAQIEPSGRVRLPTWTHESLHVDYFLSYVKAAVAFVGAQASECVPVTCDEKRLAYTQAMVDQLRWTALAQDSRLHAQDYPDGDLADWAKAADRDAKTVADLSQKTERLRQELAACITEVANDFYNRPH